MDEVSFTEENPGINTQWISLIYTSIIPRRRTLGVFVKGHRKWISRPPPFETRMLVAGIPIGYS